MNTMQRLQAKGCRLDGLHWTAAGAVEFLDTASGGAWTDPQKDAVNAVLGPSLAGDDPLSLAQAAYNEKIAGGIIITSTSNPAGLDATYAMDAQTLTQIQGLAVGADSPNLGFPGGTLTFDYPDIDRADHTFTKPQMIGLYNAMVALELAYQDQFKVMAMGGTPTWPANTATIA